MIAPKPSRLVCAAGSSTCSIWNPIRTYTADVVQKDAAMWGFNLPTGSYILSRCAFVRARQGDTHCKDYIPRFPAAGLA